MKAIEGNQCFMRRAALGEAFVLVGTRIQPQAHVLDQSLLSNPSQGLLTSVSPAFF